MPVDRSMDLPFNPDCVLWRSDSKQIVVGCSDHYGEVWRGALVLLSVDGDEINEERRIDTYTGVSDCAYLGTENQFVSTHDDSGVHIWDQEGQHLSSLVGHTHAALCVDVSTSGTEVATGGEEGVLRVWDVVEPEVPKANLRDHKGKIQALAWGT